MTDKTITLVTGTRKGVGKYLVEHYVKQGHLVIGCSREAPDWKLDNYVHFDADVSDEKQVRPIFLHIAEHYGHLDNLINNAGVASMNHSFLTPISTVRKMLETNVVGTFLFCQEAARLMQRRKFGRIVNFSTVAVPLKLEGETMYAASKCAVVMMTSILAKEYAEFGITINAVGPNPIDTDLIRGISGERMERLLARHPIPRYGTFEDVSNVIDFFIKKESSLISGQTIYLGGV